MKLVSQSEVIISLLLQTGEKTIRMETYILFHLTMYDSEL
jgi:hypothetical protein